MTNAKVHLRIPGPTPCPEEVLEAMTAQMINHRGPAFKKILERVTDRLKEFFQTENDLYVMTSSGTGAMEASVVNTLSPGDRVLALTIGSFGDRFVQIATGLRRRRRQADRSPTARPSTLTTSIRLSPTTPLSRPS